MLNNFNGFSLLMLQLCCTLFETSQLICRANQLTGFYMMGTLVVKRLSSQRSRQWSSWSLFEECSVTCGQGKKIQRRRCVTVDNNSSIDTCIGPRIKESPCANLNLICPSVEEPCNCGCNFNKENGKIRSRITNKKKVDCVWTITTEPHSYVQLRISAIRRGSLFVSISPTKKAINLHANDDNLKLPFTIKSDTNWMNISLYYDDQIHKEGEIYFEADFIGKEIVDSQNDGQINTIVVLGISACAVIILVVIVTVIYRRCQQTTSNKDGTIEDANEDNYSSTSSARSSKPKAKQTSSDEHNMSLLSTEKRLSFDKTNAPQLNPNNGFVDSRGIFRGVNGEILQSQQQNLMVHPQLLSWQVPTASYAMNQSTVVYTPQGPIMHEPKLIAYPASHISG